MSDNQPPASCHVETPPPPSDNPFINGLWKHNPVFVTVLGMCPTLAITNSVRNAVAMGLATTFVLALSNALVSMIRKIIPNQVRIASYIAIIATAVTIADYLVKAISIPVYLALGAFIPLIVSNCITLERAEAYAGKQPVWKATLDGFGSGFGFGFALCCLGTIREVLGAGTFLGFHLFGPNFEPWVLFVLPPGGFIALAIWLLIFATYRERKEKRKKALAQPASELVAIAEVHS